MKVTPGKVKYLSEITANADLDMLTLYTLKNIKVASILYAALALEGKIDNDDIKAAAGIALNKLASAVYTETEVDNLIDAHAEDVDAHHTPVLMSNGSYTGNGATNRDIPHGLGVVPRLVFITCPSEPIRPDHQGFVTATANLSLDGHDVLVTSWDATNFYVSHNEYLYFNTLDVNYEWIALGW